MGGGGGKGKSKTPDYSKQQASYERQIAQQAASLKSYQTQLTNSQNSLNAQIASNKQYAKDVEAQRIATAEQTAREKAEAAAIVEQNRITAGKAGRDEVYGSYLNAAGAASDFVNSEIRDEQAKAALLGVDYAITDEQKSQRINDYFASVWGEGEQQQLEQQFEEWGTPDNFTGFAVTRGDGSKYGDATVPGSEKVVAGAGEFGGGYDPDAIGGGLGNILADDEDDDTLGGDQNILGG